MKIGIVVLATNAYYILGIRFIKKFIHYYTGNAEIHFFFFSDKNPYNDLYKKINCEYFHIENKNWVEGTNLKFNLIKSLQNYNCDYLFYFDADTNIKNEFTEDWFIGDLVGGQHFGDQSFMKEVKNYDRNPQSSAYIPLDTPLLQIYYYGAFFGGKKDTVINMCNILHENQIKNKAIGYEPPINDESYLNNYFHYNPPTKVVTTKDFKFIISDKGGLENTRNTQINYNHLLDDVDKNALFELEEGKLYVL